MKPPAKKHTQPASIPFSSRPVRLIISGLTIGLLTVLGVHVLSASHAQSPYAVASVASGSLTTPAEQSTATSSAGQPVAFGDINDPSGQDVPIGDQPGWHQIYYDNFANESVPVGGFSGCSFSNLTCSGLPTALQSRWFDYPDGTLDTQKDCQYMPSQTLSIANGLMNMYIHTNSDGICETAVPEPKIPNPNGTGTVLGQLYGMYSVRFRSDAVLGYKTAFLLWPDDNQDPYGGEIDFPEGELDGDMFASLHWGATDATNVHSSYTTTTTYTSWHTATIEWSPTDLKFIMDGQVIGESTTNIPTVPMYWVLQTESNIDDPAPPITSAGNLQVDWVSIWSYDPSAQ